MVMATACLQKSGPTWQYASATNSRPLGVFGVPLLLKVTMHSLPQTVPRLRCLMPRPPLNARLSLAPHRPSRIELSPLKTAESPKPSPGPCRDW